MVRDRVRALIEPSASLSASGWISVARPALGWVTPDVPRSHARMHARMQAFTYPHTRTRAHARSHTTTISLCALRIHFSRLLQAMPGAACQVWATPAAAKYHSRGAAAGSSMAPAAMYLGLDVTDLAKHVYTRVYARSTRTPRGAESEKVAEAEAALLKVQEDAACAKTEDDAARSQNILEKAEEALAAGNANCDATEAKVTVERIEEGSARRVAFGSALPGTAHSESGGDAAFESAGSDQASCAPAALQTIACDGQVSFAPVIGRMAAR